MDWMYRKTEIVLSGDALRVSLFFSQWPSVAGCQELVPSQDVLLFFWMPWFHAFEGTRSEVIGV